MNRPRHAPKPARGEDRVLLLEFVNADQLPGRISTLFPLIAGRYAESGGSVRWLRFGLPTTHFLEYRSDSVSLPGDEMGRLLRAVKEFQPTHVVCTDTLEPSGRRQIQRHAPGVRFFEALSHARTTATLPRIIQGNLLTSLDRPDFLPRYDWEPGNEAASRREIDNIYLVLRQSCGHRLPVARAPHYAGVADPRVAQHRGCAFCISGCFGIKRRPPGRCTTPVAWIRKQISGIVKTRGAHLPNSVLLESLPSPGLLRVCLEEMQTAGMEAVQIQLGIRTNLAPRMEQILRAHFARHPSSRTRIGVYASGIESFDARELLLFNKGTTPLDNLRAINIYRRLAQEFGDRFSYYGLSMILFTPWTTLDGLDLNLGMCRLLGLRRHEIGNLYQSRLRLHPELPLTALAEHQRLIVKREPDPLLRMNRRKLFSEERAWRFADQRLRALCRLVLRFDLLETPLADPLARDLALRLRNSGWRGEGNEQLLDLTRCMIEVLRVQRRPLAGEALLGRAFERWRERQLPLRRPRRIGPRRVELAELLDRLARVVSLGGRRVCSIDDLTRPELDSVAALLERRGLPFALVERRGQPSGPGTLFFARERGALARRLELERAMADSTGAARRGAVLEAGLLHGVPECCARAYAAGPLSGAGLEGWASFARRAEQPGRIPAAFHPFFSPEVGFVPCRARCERALRRCREDLAALGDGPREDRVYLCSLDGWECYAFRVRAEGESSLEVEPDPSNSAGGWAEVLRQGRRVDISPIQLRIHGEAAPLAVLTATHGLWWSRRCLFPDEWSEMARAVAWRHEHSRIDPPPVVGEPEPEQAPAQAPAPERREGLVFAVIDRTAADPEYVFRVARHQPGCTYLLRCGPWVMWYSHRELTARSREVARVLAGVMRLFLGRPLSAASVEPWRAAFGEALSAAGLAPELRWSVSWREDCVTELDMGD
jgi:hypothetical protein